MNDERHYSPQELAAQWNVSPGFIRKHFRRQPGVVKLNGVWRIPASVATRVYSSWAVRPAPKASRFVARRAADGAVVRVPRDSRAA